MLSLLVKALYQKLDKSDCWTANDVKWIDRGLFNVFEDFPGDTVRNIETCRNGRHRVKIANICTPLRYGSDIFQNRFDKILQKSFSLTWSIASLIWIIHRKVCWRIRGFALIKQEDAGVHECSSSNLLPYTCPTSVPLGRDRYQEVQFSFSPAVSAYIKQIRSIGMNFN
jgi:hypothetical protein